MLLDTKSLDPKVEKQRKLLTLRDELVSLQESLIQVPGKDYKYFAGNDLYSHIIEVAKSLYDGEVTSEDLKEAGLVELALLIQNLLDDLNFYFSKEQKTKTLLPFKTSPAEAVVEKLKIEEKMSLDDWIKAREKLQQGLQL